MPWNESTKMDEKISQLCEEFGISRVTGHKIIYRYKES